MNTQLLEARSSEGNILLSAENNSSLLEGSLEGVLERFIDFLFKLSEEVLSIHANGPELNAYQFVETWVENVGILDSVNSEAAQKMSDFLTWAGVALEFAFVVDDVAESVEEGFQRAGQLGAYRSAFVEISLALFEKAFDMGLDRFTDFVQERLFTTLNPAAVTAGLLLNVFDDAIDSLIGDALWEVIKPELIGPLESLFMNYLYPVFDDILAGSKIGGTDPYESIFGDTVGGNDQLIGDNEANTFYGYGGNDTFKGLGGVDTYFGGPGRDTIELRDGVNWSVKHFGDVSIGSPDEVYFNGKIQNLEDYSGIEVIRFGDGGDRLQVNSGTLTAIGMGGVDTLVLDGQAELYSGRRDGSNIIITRGNDLKVTVTGFDLIDFLGDSSPAIDIFDIVSNVTSRLRISGDLNATAELIHASYNLGTDGSIITVNNTARVTLDTDDPNALEQFTTYLIGLFGGNSSSQKAVNVTGNKDQLSANNANSASNAAEVLLILSDVTGNARQTRFIVDGRNPDVVEIVTETNSSGPVGSSNFDYGNSFSQAYETHADFDYSENNVGGTDDQYDVLKFTAQKFGEWSLNLSNLTTNLGVILYDSNFNILTFGARGGTLDEAISYDISASETYFISIYSDSGLNGNYSLNMSFVPDDNDTPEQDGPDLVVTRTELSLDTFQTGEEFTIEWRVKNIGESASERSYSGIFLSEDQNVTASDLRIDQERTVSLLQPNSTDPEDRIITLPSDLEPGTYYIAVIANYDGSVNEDGSNNRGEVIEITIEGEGADYTVSNLRIDSEDNNVRVGEELDVAWYVNNIGDENGRTVSTALFLSQDDTISSDDIELGSDRTSRFELGESGRGNLDYIIPDDLSGAYYLIAVVNYDQDDPEQDLLNNTQSIQIEVLPGLIDGFDVAVQNLELPSTIVVDEIVDFEWTVENFGDAGAPSQIVRFLFSTDNVVSDDDFAFRSDSTGFMSGAEVHTELDRFRVPEEYLDGTNVVSGTHYIIAVYDPNNLSPDIDVQNNTYFAAVHVQGKDSDLQVSNFILQDTTVQQGDYGRLNFSLENAASFDEDDSSTAGVYLSYDSLITTDDVLLGTVSSSGLFRSSSRQYDIAVEIPHFVTPGDYFIGVVADIYNITPEQDENNNVSQPFEISILPTDNQSRLIDVNAELSRADFAINYGPSSNGIDRIGFEVEFNIQNTGNTLFPNARWSLYQSNSLNEFDFSDHTFRGRFAPLDVNGVYSFTTYNDVDGNHFVVRTQYSHLYSINLMVVADSTELADEVDEGNNISKVLTIVINPTTDGADEIYLSQSNDIVYALAGNDVINGSRWSDYIDGGFGNDQFNLANGDDHAWGGAGDDVIKAGDGNDTLSGGIDNDLLMGGAGADFIDGGEGVDTASYEDANSGVTASLRTGIVNAGDAAGDRFTSIENLQGSDFSDRLWGHETANVLEGGNGNDFLKGQGGDDTLDGGFGVDWLNGGSGADVLDGGAGQDWADYITSSSAVTVNLETNMGTGGDAEGDTYILVERLYGSTHDDSLTGNGGVNYLRGWLGDDQLFGGAGNDYLQGGAGADFLDGGLGANDWAYYVSSLVGLTIDLGNPSNNTGEAIGDTYINIENIVGTRLDDLIYGDNANNILRGLEGNDRLFGGDGDDFLRGDQDADLLDGGNGRDWAYYATSNAAVTIDLGAGIASGGDAEGDSFISIERVFGSVFADNITGDMGANYLRGFSGNDTLFGGAGIDFLQGDAGADAMDGGSGTDWAYYASSLTELIINLGDASQNTGEAAGDSYISIENIVGGRFNDSITGDGDDNYLRGFLGDDTINGGAGNDTLRGDQGADIFVFEAGSGNDVIIDWVDADDFLDLTSFGVADAMNYALQAGDDVVFTFGTDVITIENTTLAEIVDNIFV